MNNKEIVSQIYADFGLGNIPGILNVLSDEIVFDTPGPSLLPWAGIWKGKNGVMDFFNQVGSSTSYQKFEPLDIIEEGDKVSETGRAEYTTIKTGKSGVSQWIMAWTLRNGKVEQVLNLWETYSIAETYK